MSTLAAGTLAAERTLRRALTARVAVLAIPASASPILTL